MFSTIAKSHDNVMSFEDMSKAFGWNFEKTQIITEKLDDGMFVMFGVGGNILVSVGDDGTMIVDDQFPQMMPKIQAALSEVGSSNVDYSAPHYAGNVGDVCTTGYCVNSR